MLQLLLRNCSARSQREAPTGRWFAGRSSFPALPCSQSTRVSQPFLHAGLQTMSWQAPTTKVHFTDTQNVQVPWINATSLPLATTIKTMHLHCLRLLLALSYGNTREVRAQMQMGQWVSCSFVIEKSAPKCPSTLSK